jgi:hypothetical protein
MSTRKAIAAIAVTIACARAEDASAFCGFYIDGAGQEMFADATHVVLMRKGTRTVLSMQNDYKGPLADFAMVIPVPVVLKQGDVKTLRADVLDRVDKMGAPRLVEYWEQDPCPEWMNEGGEAMGFGVGAGYGSLGTGSVGTFGRGGGVKVEAKFDVDEYQIVILSAKDSTGLDEWLRDQKYKIPPRAEALFRPYVEAGMKFFVAKVNPDKVKMVGRRASLSPLRFHYDAEEFSLPIRLGLANSSGKQDLIVSILSPEQRYDVANRPNVTIPTNFDVRRTVKKRFAEFYAALFDQTLAKHPGAVVTEYAWQASKCDPCPGPMLGYRDFLELGADVLDSTPGKDTPTPADARTAFVLTRLHARYGDEVTEDLVFRKADPIAGGREEYGATPIIERGASPSKNNNFQARYAIRHWWTGPITCKRPMRRMWGGPPDGGFDPPPVPATKTAYAPRKKGSLQRFLVRDLRELGVKAYRKPKAAPKPTTKTSSLAAPPPTPVAAAPIAMLAFAGFILGWLVHRQPAGGGR